ncbi:MAG: acetyl-CoA carboxylase carboxyltransferase subunit alpha [Candidatus Brocadiia bacterium]
MDKYTLPFEEPIREIERQIERRRADPAAKGPEFEKEIRDLEAQRLEVIREIFSHLSAWDRVRIARHPSRPTSAEYIGLVFEDFLDIHGDRRFGDDKAVIAGFARVGSERVVFVGQQKGHTTKEKLACNFGMPHPEGYRKALRAMKLAEKFQLPIVTFIDTMGAYPGIGSEERGVAEAIAVNLMEMSRLRTPLLSVVIGEGGSGGALGLGTGDRLIISEYAYYSVISPEGCAAILWRSGDDAPKAAEALKLTANDLVGLGIMDEIVPEPPGGAHNDPGLMAANLKEVISRGLAELVALPVDRLLELRYQKYRRIGYFLEGRKAVSPRQPAAPPTAAARKPKCKTSPAEAPVSAAAAKNEKPAANGG